jgi:hypothetical protein
LRDDKAIPDRVDDDHVIDMALRMVKAAKTNHGSIAANRITAKQTATL